MPGVARVSVYYTWYLKVYDDTARPMIAVCSELVYGSARMDLFCARGLSGLTAPRYCTGVYNSLVRGTRPHKSTTDA